MLNQATGNPGAHALEDRGFDFYPTPRIAVDALIATGKVPCRLWEPACGDGAIATPLRERDFNVTATDIVDWGCPESYQADFLETTLAPLYVEAILTNPPYSLATEFVEHALTLVPHVFMLLRLAFLESERRTPILDTGRLHNVFVFKKRLPRMHRHGWQGNKVSSSVAFAWFHWGPLQREPAKLYRI